MLGVQKQPSQISCSNTPQPERCCNYLQRDALPQTLGWELISEELILHLTESATICQHRHRGRALAVGVVARPVLLCS